MVDTRDLKSLVGNNVPVRVRSPAPKSAAPLAGAAEFGVGDRLTRPSPGDGGVSRLVPGGDSSPALSLFERSKAGSLRLLVPVIGLDRAPATAA